MAEGAHRNQRYSRLWLWPLIAFLVLTVLVGLVRSFNRRRRRPPRVDVRATPDIDVGALTGLSDEEAAQRRSVPVQEARNLRRSRVRRQIWRASTFSIFNLGMVGLATAQVLLGALPSALLTVLVLLISIAFNAWQQLYAAARIEKIVDLPTATVLRGGQSQTRAVDEIVIDDILIAGAGDAFLADGQLLDGSPTVVEEPEIRGETPAQRKIAGDSIRAGAYCAQGRAIYRVTQTPDPATSPAWTPVRTKDEWTPLQRIMAAILRAMLGVIALLLLVLVADMAELPILRQLLRANVREALSIFFSIAPSGLYFMIVATYALASARLGELGAVVRDSQAMESLAQTSVLCFGSPHILSGPDVRLDMIRSDGADPAEARVRRILGDVVHSLRADSPLLRALQSHFIGERRRVTSIAPHLTTLGWSAVTFAEADLQGTFIIGEPDTLRPTFCTSEAETNGGQTDYGLGAVFRRQVDRLHDLLRRQDTKSQPQLDNSTDSQAYVPVPGSNVSVGIYDPVSTILQDQHQVDDENSGPPKLLFAYRPESQLLTSLQGRPQLPPDLIPLCLLTFEEAFQPDALEAVRTFVEAGIPIKLLSSDDPVRAQHAALALGLFADDGVVPDYISGVDLAQMDDEQRRFTARQATVFGHLSAGQKQEILRTLRAAGACVAMVGDAIHDVAAMSTANISVAMRSSSQAALTNADIVLLDESFDVFPTVLRQGQQIVNGMLDILKVNLTQIGYILMLIVAMLVTGRFDPYYRSIQGTVIAVLTVIVPSLGLTFWASDGRIPGRYMRSRIIRFFVPAAGTLALAALVVDWSVRFAGAGTEAAQLAVTYVLMLGGLLLVIFVQPPTRFWVGGDLLSRDRRPTYMAIGLFLLFLLAASIPFFQEWLKIGLLADVRANLVVFAVTLVWLFGVRWIWRSRWFARIVGRLSNEGGGSVPKMHS